MLIRRPVDTDSVRQLRDRAAKGETLTASERQTIEAAGKSVAEAVFCGKDDGTLVTL
jgi:hypothetical protein